MNKITRSIQVLLVVLLFCIHYTSVAQTLIPPVVAEGNGSACDRTGNTDFPIDFSFSGSVFNDDNIFFIELSDENGSFADASRVKELRNLVSTGVNNYNQKYNISTTFRLPDGTFGRNYKIRIRTTSPEMIAESVSFEAYHDMVGNSEIGINNDVDFALCDGESKEVFLTTNIVGEYEWYRVGVPNNTLVATTQNPSFTIPQPGTYFVLVNYGVCGKAISRHINAFGVSNSDAQIVGATTVEICGDEAHTFEATSNNTNYTYDWYKDGDLQQSSNSNTYITPTVGQFGTYHLIVKLDDCEIQSNNVELQQKTTADFTVNTVGTLKTIFLPGETKELCITHDASSATVQWYNNGGSMGAAANQLCINAVVPGEYFTRVTKVATGSCNLIVDSDNYELIEVNTFNVDIRTDTNYEECSSVATTLSIVGVKALGVDDVEYDLTTDQIAMLSYQWNKNGVPIAGATNDEMSVNSFLENDLYTLNVSVGSKSGVSNELDIKLITKDPEITSVPASNSLCPGGEIIYTIDTLVTGYTYEWFKDGDTTAIATDVKDFVVTEIGDYVLKISGFGCEKAFDPISVVLFDESVVAVTPSEKVVMNPGETVSVTASGAESYIWYQGEDVTGAVLSSNETLNVNTLGFYTVVASVGTCMVEKTIEVVEQDDLIIVPNVVTPNGDGKNDSWRISNRYAFQPLITIQLYNANGKEILNTTDYKNDWPLDDVGSQRTFYYKIIRDDKILKAGTISVLH